MNSSILVLLGATGDLAQYKIIPAIYELGRRGLLPPHFSLLGNGRTPHSDADFRNHIHRVLTTKFGSRLHRPTLTKLLNHTYYSPGSLDDDTTYQELSQKLELINKHGPRCDNRIFHLAILPDLYPLVTAKLGQHHLNTNRCGWVHILLEKPFGTNLASARRLDHTLLKHFHEQQIFRIDHYLAKETVQNLLSFRFANEMFEPLWNRDYIDHIQITMTETAGIKNRSAFYERTGALKDVVQNHAMQLLAMTMMDQPFTLDAAGIRESRRRLLESLVTPYKSTIQKYVVRGQYRGYRLEPGVDPHSQVETFVALKAEVNHPRWAGVPAYIRAGKKLCQNLTDIAVIFKDKKLAPSPNVINLQIAPRESIILRFFVKKPGPDHHLEPANLKFDYQELKGDPLEAYQRVLIDAFAGNLTLFTLASDVEAEWRFIDPIKRYWDRQTTSPPTYPQNCWGPKAASAMIQQDGRNWLPPSTALSFAN